MKDPKALFPLLFGSSWLGNLLLTILAFTLAFTHEGPLSPSTLFAVAVCILSGNLLPIVTYWIFTRYRQAELAAEAAEASVRLRDALKRSEEVMGRLDEAEGALSKAILIARQVPDRIKSQFQSLEALTTRLDTLELDSFTETLAGQGTSLESLHKEASAIQQAVGEIKAGLDRLPKAMGKAVKEAVPAPSAGQDDDLDVSFAERLDMMFESLEGVQDSVDGLLQRLAEAPAPVPATAETGQATGEAAASAEEAEESPAEEMAAVAPVEQGRPAVLGGQIEEADDVGESDGDSDTDADDHADSDDHGDSDDEEEELQGEMALEPQPVAAPPSRKKGGKGKVQLTVQAMVGISNKLYIRGDEPWLSWDEGQLMNLVGIGEFAWEMDDLKEPIEVEVLLNDEVETEAGRITLQPGKPVRMSLQFRKR